MQNCKYNLNNVYNTSAKLDFLKQDLQLAYKTNKNAMYTTNTIYLYYRKAVYTITWGAKIIPPHFKEYYLY